MGPYFGLDPKKFSKFQLGVSYTSCDEMTKNSPAQVGLTNHTIGAYAAVRSFVEILVVVMGNYSGKFMKLVFNLK